MYDFKIKHAQVKFSPGSIFRGIKGNLWETIESCDVSIEYLEAGGARLQGGYLRVARGKNDGLIGAETLRIGKLNIKDIKGKARLEGEYLFLDSLSAGTLSGLLQGSFGVNLDDFFKYQAELNLVNLDMDVFVKDFAFNEKVDVTGKVSGFLRLRGQKEKILAIDGNFSAGKDGGTLTIKDLRFLENIARGSGQALDLVVESFKNYRYNTGSIHISLENNNIVFLINLDGNTGKRSLNIILHDFNLLLK